MIRIFSLRGIPAQTLRDTDEWDGTNNSRQLCEGGVYVYQIESRQQRAGGQSDLVK